MMDLADLAKHLRQEHIFIWSEKEELQRLTEEVARSSEQLGHVSWITRQQKTLLEQLTCASSTSLPEAFYRRLNAVEQINFVQGYMFLNYHEGKVGEFLRCLCENPKLLAYCMTRCSTNLVTRLSCCVMNSVFGNAISPEDELGILYVLKHLVHLQVISSSSPRQLLRKGSCAFSVLFKLYTESLFSAKLFLTAALHRPIMQLLMEDEWFYDIDPGRALHRFPAAEKLRRFGSPNSPSYAEKVAEYREMIITRLFVITERFISSLRHYMYSFPPTLAWVISELYHSAIRTNHVDVVEARSMCTDLVLSLYICLAICDPELYGITSDAPLSYIARHNLMQVAQILQVLSSSQLEHIDPKVADLYGKFKKNCMAFLLDTILEKPPSETPPRTAQSSSEFSRACIFITQRDLVDLISVMRQVDSSAEDSGSAERSELHRLLELLPAIPALQAPIREQTPVKMAAHNAASPVPSSPDSPMTRKKSSKGKDKKQPVTTEDTVGDSVSTGDSSHAQQLTDDVLVISLGVNFEPPGMLPEHKVLEQEVKQKKASKSNSVLPGEDYPISESNVQVHEKRTRFSLSHDQDSIATSDNLEGVSEGASSRSVASDVENENDADNLSDMLSANVSERGTPNISGRTSPTSQPGSQMDGHEGMRAPDLPVLVRKANREDVTDKFGKFELRQELENYEAKSTVSDSWSTDVLASDSEPPEQNALERLEEVAEETVRQQLLVVKLQEVYEVSETASDAWSTDVLASDTSERPVDRLSELDQDDAALPPTPTASLELMSDNDLPDQPLIDNVTLPALAAVSGAGNAGVVSDQLSSGGAQVNRLPHVPSLEGAFGGGTSESDDNRSLLRRTGAKLRTAPADAVGSNKNAPDYISTTEDNDEKQKTVSHITAMMNQQGSQQYVRQPRVSSSFQYTGGKVASALEIFDPLHSNGQKQVKGKKLEDTGSHYQLNMPKGLASTGGNGITDNSLKSVDVNANHHGSAYKRTTKADAVTSSDESSSGDSGHGIDPVMRNSLERGKRRRQIQLARDSIEKNKDSGGGNAPSLIESDAESLGRSIHLFDQQNVNIDTNRLSSVATVDYFDILSEGSRGVAKASTEHSVPAVTNGSSVDDEGSASALSPRISLKLNSVELDLAGAGAAAVEPNGNDLWIEEGDVDVQQISQSVEAASSPVLLTGSLNGGRAAGADPSTWSVHSDSVIMSQSGHESHLERSERVVSALEGRVSFQRKDTEGDEHDGKLSPQKKKPGASAAGFLQSVKERLSRGGKRVKSSRQQEREEQHRSQSADGESSDDILAKYRKPAVKASNGQDGVSMGVGGEPVVSFKVNNLREEDKAEAPAYDPANLESCHAFLDTKKKLRRVLSHVDPTLLSWSGKLVPTRTVHGEHREPGRSGDGSKGSGDVRDGELLALLQMQLAEAINLKDRDFVAQLHETIRCLRQFDTQEVRRLVRALREEYKARSVYIAYLVRCHQGLLGMRTHVDKLRQRVERDKVLCTKHFLTVYARLFLERRERSVSQFVADFQQLSVADEKTDLVETFLANLYLLLEKDPMWQYATQQQIDEAKLYIERILMGHIYTHALFPNGDGDQMRDTILYEHLQKLSQVVTPDHKDLRIPRIYHYECPWPAAQTDLALINAYKTPQDKLHCVLRCSATIMNLLSLASERSKPAADDFMPVLLYVIIKANPPGLLSTVQYVTSFYGKRMQGEELYWWTQFTSAIEFLKTMDYE